MSKEFYKIKERHGTAPIQLVVGQNADQDTRLRIDVTYKYEGESRRRAWLTRTQMEKVYELIGQFLYGEVSNDAETSNDVELTNGVEG